jgi:HAD superfamily hydrolase (TIGR01484 family)
MDRTLLPNGSAAESPEAMPLFKRLVERDNVQVAYVSGRSRALIEKAMQEYDLPAPDFVIGDVGTNIYTVADDEWTAWDDWHDEIKHSWRGLTYEDLHQCLQDIEGLRLQEEFKQNHFKLSYYVPADIDTDSLLEDVRTRLTDLSVDYSAIWSVDEANHQGLLDILPASASKYHAVEYLLRRNSCDVGNTLFAGDSGNDLDVLCSPLRAVLVANATDIVKEQAEHLAILRGQQDALYIAGGGYLGMNGNYVAGILEGVYHYYPRLLDSLEK